MAHQAQVHPGGSGTTTVSLEAPEIDQPNSAPTCWLNMPPVWML